MAKEAYQFSDFLSAVSPEHQEFVTKIHDELTNNGYKLKIEVKANGFFASYSHPKTKRSVINFFFRKKGFYIRIYADNINKYSEILDSLPEPMELELTKAGVCKRLLNPDDCNPRCISGYDFYIKDKRYQKCRYGCFQFLVNQESMPQIGNFIAYERNFRES
jgi:hypothetical protein